MAILRRAIPNDAPSIALVQVRSWQTAYRGLIADFILDALDLDKHTSSWDRILTVPDPPIFVVGDDNGIMGFCSLSACRDDDKDNATTAEIVALYVLPEHWRRGHGRRLCERAIEECQCQGYREITLWVLTGNEPAYRFYEAMGFTRDGTTAAADESDMNLPKVRFVRGVE